MWASFILALGPFTLVLRHDRLFLYILAFHHNGNCLVTFFKYHNLPPFLTALCWETVSHYIIKCYDFLLVKNTFSHNMMIDSTKDPEHILPPKWNTIIHMQWYKSIFTSHLNMYMYWSLSSLTWCKTWYTSYAQFTLTEWHSLCSNWVILHHNHYT